MIFEKLKKADRVTVIFSFIYMFMFCLGVNYTLRHFGKSIPGVCYLLLALVSFAAIYAVLCGICRLLNYLDNKRSGELKSNDKSGAKTWAKRQEPAWLTSKKSLAVRFLIIWIPCFIIFLNMYPGTLCVDTPNQLREAMGLSRYENANPLIHTLVLTPFIRVGMRIKDVNLGIALYTFFQFTMYCVSAVYVLKVLDKLKLHIVTRVICLIFFICPINLIYATGMWKDTFFAILFLVNMAYALELLISEKPVMLHSKVILTILSLLTALARNSGWSALLAGALCMFIYVFAKRNKLGDGDRRKLLNTAICETIGTAVALFIIYVVYAAMGLYSQASYMTASVEMQQISRVIADGVYDENDAEMIKSIARSENILEEVAQNYDSSLVDYVRGYYDTTSDDFWTVWLKIGLKHPKTYFMAFADHTVNFWWPLSSSWLVDFRIFENDYGVVRTPLILKNVNLANVVYRSLFYMLPLAIFSNSGFTFWAILLCIYLCLKFKNSVGSVLCVPHLMIYIGLFIFCYGSLFRYTYSAVLAMPLLLGYYKLPFDRSQITW